MTEDQATATVDTMKEKSSSSVVGHLQTPKKKKKNIIIVALDESIDPSLRNSILKYLKTNFTNFATVAVGKKEDIVRLFVRSVAFIIINDSYVGSISETLQLLKKLKSKRSDLTVPTLFFTEDTTTLVQEYNKKLRIFQENDEYIRVKNHSQSEVISRIERGIKRQNQRRSHRYLVTIPATIKSLSSQEPSTGVVTNISIHGAEIRANEDRIFGNEEQLTLTLKIPEGMSAESGEFIRFSGKVRRVLVGGQSAAISWEHLDEIQRAKLLEYVLLTTRPKIR